MKIAIHVDGPTVRGNERQVIRIAAGLQARGHDVVVACRRGSPVQAELLAGGIRTTGVRPRGDVDLWSGLRFAGWLRHERPDAALLTSWKRAAVAAAAVRLAGVPRAVLRVGGMKPIHGGLRGARYRYVLSHGYHAFVANSRTVAERLATALPGLGGRLHLVPNGMEPPGPVRPAPLRRELAIPADALLAGAVGGCEPNKGWDLLIEAAAHTDGVHLALAGGGTNAQRSALESRARALGIAGRVHLLGPRADAAAVVAACDLFALPSRSEGFSMAMLEAMFSGTPILAASVGGTWEGIAARDGRPPAGWIVPSHDAAALSRALQEIVGMLRAGSPEPRTRAAEAEWRARNWFSLERMIDGYEAALNCRGAATE